MYKAIADLPLTPQDWRTLARFTSAQIVRTPAFFLRQRARWNKEIPVLLENVLTEMLEEMRIRRERGESAPAIDTAPDDLLPVKVTVQPDADPNLAQVSAATITGRDMWLFSMRQLLTDAVQRVEDHRWTILKPYGNLAWFTSDDPVLCLNYYPNGSYDFSGGWGKPGSEILLPLGPRHLLYTTVGSRAPQRGTVLDRPQTELLRRLIAEHAHRMVYSSVKDPEIPRLRPRRVDASAFESERQFWAKWHSEQTALLQRLKQMPESPIDDPSPDKFPAET